MGLESFLHKQKESFKGKPLAPAFNALHTFLYVPNDTTKSGSHIRDASDLKRVMSTVIVALIPCLLFGIYNVGYQHFRELGELETASFLQMVLIGISKVLPIIVVTYGVGLFIEFIFAVLRKHEVNEGFLVTGMLVPLIVPPDIPLWMLAIGVAFGVLIGKEAFGGTGMNVLNPALTVRAFLFFAFARHMSGDVWVHDYSTSPDGISGATILGNLATKQEGAYELSSIIPYSVSDMFFGFIPGSIGEMSVLAVLIGAAILIFSGVGSWRIMAASVLGASFMGFIFNLIGGEPLFDFPWWQHLLVGSFAFGTVFMATDPVTASQTNKGKWIYGFLIGFFCILIRAFNPAYPEGMMLSILLMNVFAPVIDHYVVQANKKKRLSRIKIKPAIS